MLTNKAHDNRVTSYTDPQNQHLSNCTDCIRRYYLLKSRKFIPVARNLRTTLFVITTHRTAHQAQEEMSYAKVFVHEKTQHNETEY